jgi:multicomponent K+:H+ antiporter subunit G
MSVLFELLVSALIVVGGSFALIGSVGLVKLPDLLTRLHAPTKATTLGVGGALLASMLFFLCIEGTLSIHELLITLFLFITAPVSAHFIAKAHLHQQGEQRSKLPPTGGAGGWRTFDGEADGEDETHPEAAARR